MSTTDTPLPGLTRRRLLLGGATVALAAVLGSGRDGLLPPAHRLGPLARLAVRPGTALSIGYLGTAGAADPLEPGARVVPAGTIRAGGLAGQVVRVRVDGATPGLSAAAVALDALFESPDLTDDLPLTYFAWTRSLGGVSTSNATAFSVGVEDKPSLGFTLSVTGAAGAEPRVARTVFATRQRDGHPVLRSGRYLIGLEPGVWDRPTVLPALDDPRWSRLASLMITVSR